MSCSSIIKLRSLRDKKGVVVPGASSPKFARSLPSIVPDLEQSRGQSGAETTSDLPEQSQAVSWVDQAQEVVRRARAEAQAILEEANGKADEVRQQAYRDGYEKGYTQGLAEASTEASVHIQHIAELARNAAVDMARILRTSEEGVIELALAVAEKVVHKCLVEDRSLIVSMVKGALECVDVLEVIRIRVNPEDLEILQSHWREEQFGAIGTDVELVPDASVQIGGCIIDTRKSIVDAQIEAKLAEIERAFRSELEAGPR